MAGTTRAVKRQWSTAGGQRTESLAPGNVYEDATKVAFENQNRIVADLAVIREPNEILPGFPCGLQIDGTPADVETQTLTYVRYFGQVVSIAIDAALVVATGVTASSDVDTNDKGALWIYADAEASTVCTCEASHPGATSGETTAVGALRWLPDDHYQRNAGEIPIAVVTLTEGGSAAFTWGADSISDETEGFVDFVGKPGVVNDVASIIVTAGASSTTWAHGAGGVVLGSGVYVALTAQTGLAVASNASAITTGNSGALLLYVLSDGGAEALQLTSASASHGVALAAARVDNKNPYLACIGYLIVDNDSGSDFTPGTTSFDTAGVVNTIYTLDVAGDLLGATVTTAESGD